MNTARGLGELRLTANFSSVQSQEAFPTSVMIVKLDDLARSPGGILSNVLSALGESCACVTSCPDGYEDEDGICMKACPANDPPFDERGRTCFGTEFTTFYPAWSKRKCDAAHVSRGGCEWSTKGLGYFPLCKEGYFRSGIGTCVPVCEDFGLKSAPLSVTCLRPEAGRTSAPKTEGNSCPAGATPSVDCVRVEAHFTVTRVAVGGLTASADLTNASE